MEYLSKMQRKIRWWSIGAFALVLAGCAGMLPKLEQPQVSVASIKLVEPGLLEQRYQVQLRVQNPNAIDLPIDGIQLRVEINDHPFVTGVSPHPVTVPRYGSALIDIDAVSTLAALARQFKDIDLNHAEAVRYKLSGKVHLSQPSIELPFAEEGEINLSGVMGKSPP